MFKNRTHNYQKIEDIRKSKLIVYITGDRRGMETQIHPEILEHFVEHLDPLGKVPKISLFLYTRGGNTLAAWSLVNLIRQFCEEFEVIIPSKAHSSGTLISLGANSIIMTKQATLGPIDPSLNSPLNPQNPAIPNNPKARLPVSVESIKGYLELAQEDLKIHNENELSQILMKLSDKVHPLVLGDIYRSRTQIKMLAKKLLSKQLDSQEQIEKIISFLSSDSGSHDYAIYRNEASDELGLNIEKPTQELYDVIKEVYDDIKKELELDSPYDPANIAQSSGSFIYSCRKALIESIEVGTHVFLSEGKLVRKDIQVPPPKPGMPPQNHTILNDNRTFDGWRFEKK
ncbi:SDH family Clp fold serine proteinase [Roseivirga pacifica]|uniref:SDH family Clp fold serine proteinase n=1 Tax=Roseivirga pacifica TaxID=1267423 RepID=UPI003BB1BF9F